MPGEFRQTLRLENDEAVGQIQRSACLRAAVNVPIEVGSGQDDDQGQVRMLPSEFIDGIIAAPGMKSDEEITGTTVVALLKGNAMAQLS